MDGFENTDASKYIDVDAHSEEKDDEVRHYIDFTNSGATASDFHSLPLDSSSSLDLSNRSISGEIGYRLRCSSWEKNSTPHLNVLRNVTATTSRNAGIDLCEAVNLSSDFPNTEAGARGLPEKYFLPSPTLRSTRDDAHQLHLSSSAERVETGSEESCIGIPGQNYSSFLMTRGEPMGEESENGSMILPIVNYGDGSSAFTGLNAQVDDDENYSELSETESGNSSAGQRQAERPPVVGQSNDPRGQVASGMSCNSSDDVCSTYNSALSGSWHEEEYSADLDGDRVVRDSLAVQVSLLLGNVDSAHETCAAESPVHERVEASAADSREHNVDVDSNLNETDLEGMHMNSENITPIPDDKVSEAIVSDFVKYSDNVVVIGNNDHASVGVEARFDATENAILPVKASEHRSRIVYVEAEMEKFTPGDVRPVSPTSVSSVASSKRLEWDSGADIGYKSVSTSTISKTEAEVLQWANHRLPLTRTEPEGKSFQKEKGGTAGVTRVLPAKLAAALMPSQISESDVKDKTGSFKNQLEVEKINLASSMTSITSKLYQEVLYGLKDELSSTSKVNADDDVIVRVRKLLKQTNRSTGSSPLKDAEAVRETNDDSCSKHPGPEVHFVDSRMSDITSEADYLGEGSYRRNQKPSCPENSPSHSSSSWSVKSSNTVVMTPVGQRIDEFGLFETEPQSSFVHLSDATPGIPQYENRIFFRHSRPTNVEVSSVSVQTEPKNEVSVPRPVFPRGKSKSLDILPTVLVDVAVNTEFPYSPSSEENVTSPEDVLIIQRRNEAQTCSLKEFRYPSTSGVKILASPAVAMNHAANMPFDEVSEGEIDDSMVLDESQRSLLHHEQQTDLDQFARDNNLVQDGGLFHSSDGRGWAPEIPVQPHYKYGAEQLRKHKRRSGSSTRSWCKNVPVSEEKSTQRVTPYW